MTTEGSAESGGHGESWADLMVRHHEVLAHYAADRMLVVPGSHRLKPVLQEEWTHKASATGGVGIEARRDG